MKSEIEYPILLISIKNNNLYGMNNGLGLISKGGESFYKKSIQIIDQRGFLYEIKGITGQNRASLIDSIRYFQPMKQLTFELEQIGQKNLDELKSIILEHIKRKPRNWLSLGTIDMIEEWVNGKKSIADLIQLFT